MIMGAPQPNAETEAIIKLVRSRSILWNSQHERYKDKQLKKKAWDEICSILDNDYPNKDVKSQYKTFKYVSTKWKSARDSFFRTLRREKLSLEKVGPSVSKYRKYVYHDLLLFLVDESPNRSSVNGLPDVPATCDSAQFNQQQLVNMNNVSNTYDLSSIELIVQNPEDLLNLNMMSNDEHNITTTMNTDKRNLNQVNHIDQSKYKYMNMNNATSSNEVHQHLQYRVKTENNNATNVNAASTAKNNHKRKLDPIDEKIMELLEKKITEIQQPAKNHNLLWFESIVPTISDFSLDEVVTFRGIVNKTIADIRSRRAIDSQITFHDLKNSQI